MNDPDEMSPLWLLARARERERVLAAIVAGQARWRELAEIVGGADDASDARARVAEQFGVDEGQATALLDMQLRRLPRAARTRVESELAAVRNEIGELERLAGDDPP